MQLPLVRVLRSLLSLNSAGLSQVDVVYRSLLSNNFFSLGWGQPSNVQTLLEFQKIVSNRIKCNELVDQLHPVSLRLMKKEKHYTVFHGELRSPVVDHLPGFYPKQCETANFQFCVPNHWPKEDKPVCVHMSGTGDHFYWRRRLLLAKPLLRRGVASLLMENPYYGSRKPENQSRSNLNHVDNIFLMGAGLILESLAILRFLEKEGYGPFCLTGISMGGHMASLAATSWPKPIAVVPCLSWTSASGVFTRGVMSKVVNWDKLVEQFESDPAFKEEIATKLCNFPWVLTQEYSTAKTKLHGPAFSPHIGWNESYKKEQQARLRLVREKYIFRLMDKIGLARVLNEILNPKDKHHILVPGADNTEIDLITYLGEFEPSFEAVEFMRRLMDHFTHLANFEKPIDPELAIIVAARSDAYVLRDGVQCIQDIWPGATVRYVDAGHILAYVKHQTDFMNAIVEVIDKYRERYNTDGTPKSTHSA